MQTIGLPNAIIEDLERRRAAHKHRTKSCDLRIRGSWDIELDFWPSDDERRFQYRVVSVLIQRQGSAYAPPETESKCQGMVGKCAFDVLEEVLPVATKVAVVDAILAGDAGLTTARLHMDGRPSEKATWRAGVIADAVASVGLEPGSTVLNVGAVSEVIRALKRRAYRVLASDMDPSIVGQSIDGTLVQSGDLNSLLLRDADIALVTGMTLTNGSFAEIQRECVHRGTPIALFAETGSAIAETMARQGSIALAIAEPFPFYVFQGKSEIRIVRAGERPRVQ